jgi:hypothetical protein
VQSLLGIAEREQTRCEASKNEKVKREKSKKEKI